MDFSSLVLIEKNKNNEFVREMDSFCAGEGAEYVTKFYYDGEAVNIFFSTGSDVEDWEFSAIYDCFNYDKFKEENIEIEDIDTEYNPTWRIKIGYNEDRSIMQENLNNILKLINEEIKKVFETIKGKENLYINTVED